MNLEIGDSADDGVAAYEWADFRIDHASHRVSVDGEHDKPLLMQAPVIHLAIKLDDRTRFQAPADLHLEEFF